ncbi:MAG: hypothetical protein AAGF24_13600 [Cyanobacteria bacterium P01_H01_bin.121]
MLDPKVALQVQKGIRQAEDELVTWIQEALEQTTYASGYNGLSDSQFRNLLRVADTTESSEVVKNFLRYQVGRDPRWGRGKGSLSERIIEDIDGRLHAKAESIAQVSKSTNLQEIWIDLIRRYLGYGTRYLKFKSVNQ